jgi:hypothetical protein
MQKYKNSEMNGVKDFQNIYSGFKNTTRNTSDRETQIAFKLMRLTVGYLPNSVIKTRAFRKGTQCYEILAVILNTQMKSY